MSFISFDNKGFFSATDSELMQALDLIKERYQNKKKQIQNLWGQLKNFKAQVYKDEELAKMKQSYDRMKKDYNRGFAMTEEQTAHVHDWRVTHENNHHGGYPAYHGVSGGGYAYEFVPTAIGLAQRCICTSCRYKALKNSGGDGDKYEDLLKKYDAVFDFTGDW